MPYPHYIKIIWYWSYPEFNFQNYVQYNNYIYPRLLQLVKNLPGSPAEMTLGPPEKDRIIIWNIRNFNEFSKVEDATNNFILHMLPKSISQKMTFVHYTPQFWPLVKFLPLRMDSEEKEILIYQKPTIQFRILNKEDLFVRNIMSRFSKIIEGNLDPVITQAVELISANPPLDILILHNQNNPQYYHYDVFKKFSGAESIITLHFSETGDLYEHYGVVYIQYMKIFNYILSLRYPEDETKRINISYAFEQIYDKNTLDFAMRWDYKDPWITRSSAQSMPPTLLEMD